MYVCMYVCIIFCFLVFLFLKLDGVRDFIDYMIESFFTVLTTLKSHHNKTRDTRSRAPRLFAYCTICTPRLREDTRGLHVA